MPDRDSGLLPAKTNRNCRYKQAVENSADEFLQIKIFESLHRSLYANKNILFYIELRSFKSLI